MQDFKNLKVWQRAHEFALLTYRITAEFPKDEVFGLRHLKGKSATDIPAYIAEGCGKANDSDFSRSIASAVATAYRLEYYALMARDLEFIGANIYDRYVSELTEIKKMLNGFNRRLG
jgi:four helix bundle protein